MRNILLTGGTGFIGKNFTKILKNKYKIFLLVNKTKKTYISKMKKISIIYFLMTSMKLKIFLKKKKLHTLLI